MSSRVRSPGGEPGLRPERHRHGAGGSPARRREMVGESGSIAELRRLAGKVGPKMATLLIHGESGTGKEVLARYIYDRSLHREGPFIAINCAAIPESLVESELFGHERGAFTGAVTSRRGCFEEANGGTLFLDEVTEISLQAQAKLLRVLQEGEIRRVGGTSTQPVNVRIIAATSRDPREAVGEGILREDLYYRLATVELFIPPLRERTDDVRSLVRFFLDKHAAQNGSVLIDVGDEALGMLQGYSWPGNVRELENAVARATVLAGPEDGERVLAHHLPPTLQGGPGLPSCPSAPPAGEDEAAAPDGSLGGELRAAQSQLRRTYADEALRRCSGNKAGAARLLGVSRRGFYNLLEGAD
ncbi:MAG TPA: sigma-54 dependent transcriptional regulator [Longimicrobium sp.]|nr:sigma-54 dependent transcriptional regulator [Longimicrobium sp.]